MSQRRGGFELAERQEGMRALLEARSPEALAKLLDEFPVLYDPVFHQDVVRLLSQPQPQDERLLLERFFCFLDWKAQQHQATASTAQNTDSRADALAPYAPPYFQQLMELLGGRVPPCPQGRPLAPATEQPQIAAALEAVRGTPGALPAYVPVPGSQWGIVVIECLRCHVQRPEARALHIDLTRLPELREPLAQGRINNAGCPRCGFRVGLPAGAWILEPPWPPDPLATLSCIIQVDPIHSLYLPSCWRQPDHRMDVVLETRSSLLLQVLRPDEPPPKDLPQTRMCSIIYSQEELAARLNAPLGGGQLPPVMEAIEAQVAHHLEAEQMSLEEARAFLRQWAAHEGKDWPVLMSPIYLDEMGRPLRAVAHALLAGQLAELQGYDVLDRILFSIQMVMMLLAAQRVGQAEAELARAEGLWTQAPQEDEQRSRFLGAMIEGAHADILVRKERYPEAAQRRQRAEELFPLDQEGSWWERHTFWRYRAMTALHLRRVGQFEESLAAFARSIPMLERLQDEALLGDAARGRERIAWAQHALSGALANCASVLLEGDAVFSAEERGEARAAPTDEGTRAMAWVLEYAERLSAWRAEPEVGKDKGARRWVAAGRLLTRALDLSQSARSWDFAAAQSGRMTDVLEHFGLLKEAVNQASEWATFARRAGQHLATAEALFFVGRMGLRLVDEAAGALDLFESAAECLLRALVSQGPDAQLPSWAPALVELSFMCAFLKGADAGQAVMIAESLKAALTAVDVEVGVPGGGVPAGQGANPGVEALARRREELRLDAFQFMPGEPELTERREAIEAVEGQLAEARRALGLRDERYVRWCEPAYTHLSTVDGIVRRLEALTFGATYLGFSIGMAGIWTYAFWSEGGILDLVSWPDWREDLKRLEDPDALRESGALGEVLERMSQHLLAPLQKRLEAMTPSDRLLISPSQALMHVPFARFRTEAGMLAERVVLSLVTGAGLFEACFDRRPGPISSALLVGVHRHDYRPALPFARDEVKQLERLFADSARKVRTLLDREATARAVLSEAATYDVVHFACHAQWSPEAAVRPQLVLSPEFARERGEDSGELTDWRIVGEMRLRPGALVNLSACQSARQKEGGAEVRDGLVPAFFRAGAGAAIATLWSIRDAPSPRFQAALYEHLLAGQGPAHALALTIRRCIRGELGPALEDPLVWSAFVLHGVG